MPGLCGIIDHPPHASERVAAMLAHQRRYEWHRTDAAPFDAGEFGHVRVEGAGLPGGARAFARTGEIVVAFDGELYTPPTGDGASDAERLGRGILSEGRAFLRNVHGCFTAAVWDGRTGLLTLTGDRFGMRPLFWSHRSGTFLFASEVGALLAGGMSSEPSSTGWAEFLAFGQLLGDSTLYEHAHAAPSAPWITYDRQRDRVTVESYETSRTNRTSRADAEWLDEIDELFAASVKTCCTGGGALGLSLSGGLDARTILGVAPEGARLQCVSLGIPGSIDLRAAESMARLANQPFQAHHLDGDFLARFEPLLTEVVRLTDGHYLDQGIVLTTLQGYRELGLNTLLRGHAGELLHMTKAYAFSMDETAERLEDGGALADWLWRHLTGYMLGDVGPDCFTGAVGTTLRDEARASLERQIGNWDHVEPVPQRIWQLFVHERLRRETAMSLQMFRSFVEVRLPYLEPRLVDTLLAAPVHLKLGDTIQSHILRRRKPEFLRIVNANTGAPMEAGEIRARLGTLQMKVLAKLGVKGYQPYERLGLWLARDLQPLLRRTLLDAAGPAPFEPVSVATLLAQHASREKNHTFLLMAQLILRLAGHPVPAPALQGA